MNKRVWKMLLDVRLSPGRHARDSRRLRHGKKPLYDVKLSSGYTVPIDLYNIFEDVSHLCTALIMEIFIPNLKKLGIKKARTLLQEEIVGVCNTLNDESKLSILSVLLWCSVCDRYDELRKEAKKSKKR